MKTGLFISLLLIAAAALVAGCGGAVPVGGVNTVTEQGRIPPIDVDVPAVTETATFALG
jgi:hypothetical protein